LKFPIFISLIAIVYPDFDIHPRDLDLYCLRDYTTSPALTLHSSDNRFTMANDEYDVSVSLDRVSATSLTLFVILGAVSLQGSILFLLPIQRAVLTLF
jgi:hypothetical protein